jgi:hypothetical protein
MELVPLYTGLHRILSRLGNGANMLDAKFVRCYLELFLEWDSCENLPEGEVGRICFRSSTVSRATTYNVPVRKKNGR